MAREVRLEPRLASRRRRLMAVVALLVIVALVAEFRWPAAAPHHRALRDRPCRMHDRRQRPVTGVSLPRLPLAAPRRDLSRTRPGRRCPVHYTCHRCQIEWDTGWLCGGSSGPYPALQRAGSQSPNQPSPRELSTSLVDRRLIFGRKWRHH